jgi:hypothetical protein
MISLQGAKVAYRADLPTRPSSVFIHGQMRGPTLSREGWPRAPIRNCTDWRAHQYAIAHLNKNAPKGVHAVALVDLRGIEPLTSSMPRKRPTVVVAGAHSIVRGEKP